MIIISFVVLFNPIGHNSIFCIKKMLCCLYIIKYVFNFAKNIIEKINVEV